MPSQPPVGPGQPFLLQATAVDLDSPLLPLQYLWVQISGPDTAIFDDVTKLEPTVVCNSLGFYTFQLNATNGYTIVSTNVIVEISKTYLAAAQFTAYCGSGSNGLPVTIIAGYESIISLDDAYAQAAAIAQAQAYAALVCRNNIAPLVNITGETPFVGATVTYTADCTPPYVGTPITITYTFSDTGRDYPSIESSALSVVQKQANSALICNRGNKAPVIRVVGFSYTVQAIATATATCPEITSSAYGSASTSVQTLQYHNIPYQEAENRTFETARAVALAGLKCVPNLGPQVTITDWTPQVSATVTVVVVCPFGNKGAPVLVQQTFTGSDYYVAEATAVQAAYAQANAQLVCVPNIAPNVYIVTSVDLVYRCQVPYRNRNSYRSALSANPDFLYIATVTASAVCPQGQYGVGAYATATGTSITNYPTAEANATAAALAQAQAQLVCAPTPNKIGIRTYNALAGQSVGTSQVLGIYRLLTGTLAVPTRMKFLGAYTVPLVFHPRFLDNIIYLDAYNDQLSGSWTYVFYFGRPHSDGSYVFQPDSAHIRLDNVYPAGGATMGSLVANAPAGILSAAGGVLSINSLQTLQYANLSVATAPYLAFDTSGWENPTDTYAGIMVMQTDPGLTTILNYGLLSFGAQSAWTEKTVIPLPFTPTFTDWTTPLTFVFCYASTGAGPLGYVLSAGVKMAPTGASIPWQTDYSLVAWTHAAANNQPAYVPSTYTGTPTLSSSAGNVTLPAGAIQSVVNFARTEDVKIILRRHRQRLFN